MKKSITIEEEVRLEGVLELTGCQKAIETFCEEDDVGICGVCKKAEIGFYDQVYLSKYVITETCKARCPFLKDNATEALPTA